MSSADRDPHPAPSSVPHVAQPHPKAHVSFWVRELPFTLVLILTIARRCVHELFKETDRRLLGNSRADHRAGLRRRRVAGGGRQERAICV